VLKHLKSGVRSVFWRLVEHVLLRHPYGGKLVSASVLRANGLEPSRVTDSAQLRELLTELHPVAIGVPLMRLGPDGDGGYLVPDDLGGIVACFSPGVDTVSGFEVDCADRGMRVFLADASVDAPAVDDARLHFSKRNVANVTDEHAMTIDDWMRDALGTGAGDLMMQMDIEGAEWSVLPDISPQLMSRFRVLVVELHHLGDLHIASAFTHMAAVLRRILHTHVCMHIHPNNCGAVVTRHGIEIPDIMEFTFVRRDAVTVAGFVTEFPHPLDVDNVARPAVVLPAVWWHS